MARMKNEAPNDMAATKEGVRQSKRRSADLRRQIYGIIWVAVGVLLFLSMSFNVVGVVGSYISDFGRGMLGISSFVLPLVPIYAGVQMIIKETRWRVNVKSWTGLVMLFVISAFAHMVLGSPIEGQNMATALYESGIDLSSGGIIGGGIAMLFTFLFDKTGAYIIFAVAFIICIMIETEMTPYNIWRFFKMRRNIKKQEDKQSEQEQMTLDSIPVSKKPFNIDIPINSEPKTEKKQTPATPFISDDREKEILEKLNPKKTDGKPDTHLTSEPVSQEDRVKYSFPPLTLLQKDVTTAAADISDELRANALKLVETLKSFGVETKVVNVSRGPSVTRYELQPNAGVKVSRIVNLADDIALNLASSGVRIEAPIPGKAAVGIEVPNLSISPVHLRPVLESNEFKHSQSKITAALGRDIAGNPVAIDLAKMPHLLIAGATGSGKSVCINTLITSILYNAMPDEVRMLMVDPKVVELGCYNGIPHLLIPVVTDPKKAAGALNWAVSEMLNRYKLFAELNVRDIKGYNLEIKTKQDGKPLPQVVIIIDELADLMMAAPNDVEDAICRLAQMARAAGMHLVIATQRPSVDVITGVIKANIPSRISFAVSSQVDSRTILDMGGAEKLLGKGDMLYYPSGTAKPARVQGCFISDKEVESVVDYIKKSQIAAYNEDIIQQIESHSLSNERSSGNGSGNTEDEMFYDAIEIIIDAGLASVSLLQRKLKLGYARAARIIDDMEERGIVGPFEGSKPRRVIITRQQFIEMKLKKADN